MRFIFGTLFLLSIVFAEAPVASNYGPGSKLIHPFEAGVNDFSWPYPFWLVSTNSFTGLLASKATDSNREKERQAMASAVKVLAYQTNLDIKYIEGLEKRIRKLEAEVFWKITGSVIATGLVFYGIYELASSQVQRTATTQAFEPGMVYGLRF